MSELKFYVIYAAVGTSGLLDCSASDPDCEREAYARFSSLIHPLAQCCIIKGVVSGKRVRFWFPILYQSESEADSWQMAGNLY